MSHGTYLGAHTRAVNRNAFQKPSLPNQRGEKYRSSSRDVQKREAQPAHEVKLSEDDELSMIEKNPDAGEQSMQSTYHSKPPLGQAAPSQKQHGLSGLVEYEPSASTYLKFSSQGDSFQQPPIEKSLRPQVLALDADESRELQTKQKMMDLERQGG